MFERVAVYVRPDPVLFALVLILGWAYWRAYRRARDDGRRRRVSPWRARAFALGLAVLAVAFLSPLDWLGTRLLSANFAGMFLVTMVAPPLMQLGQPLTLLFRAADPESRRRLRRAYRGRVATILTFPVAAWLLFAVVTYLWQFSSLTEWAVRWPAVRTLQHLSLFFVAWLFWWPALCSDPVRWRMGYTLRIFYVLVEMTHKGLFGGMFLAAQTPFHEEIAAKLPSWAPDPMVDQRLAILILWVGGSLVFFAAIVGIARHWVLYDARYSRRLDRRLAKQREAERRRRAALEQIFRRPV